MSDNKELLTPEYDMSFAGFDVDLLTYKSGEVFYDGILVINKNKTKAIEPGTEVMGRKISSKQAISLWQQCYINTYQPYDPFVCAQIYRQVNNICHVCCGDKEVELWVKDPATGKREPVRVTCSSCKGTGLIQA